MTLIAVSKTFPADAIEPVIEQAGQRVFGENRVQEAKAKWPALLSKHPGIELHLIGPLQSNKAKEAVALFDAIHSVDRDSLCEALAKEIAAQKRTPLLFVEINTGAEAAEGRRAAAGCRCVPEEMRGRLRPEDFRPDVHSAGRRGAGPAFRADGQDRQAQWAEAVVDGHERRLRDRDPARRHACARRQRDLRRTAESLRRETRRQYGRSAGRHAGASGCCGGLRRTPARTRRRAARRCSGRLARLARPQPAGSQAWAGCTDGEPMCGGGAAAGPGACAICSNGDGVSSYSRR